MPAVVRRLHCSCRVTGRFDIERGAGWLAGPAAYLFGLPPAGRDVATSLVIEPDRGGLKWSRRFGATRLVTHQRALGDGIIAERIGAIECSFVPLASAEGIEYRQTGARLCAGPLRLPLPRILSPRVEAWVRARGEAAEVDVAVSAPLIGRLVHYRGVVQPGGNR